MFTAEITGIITAMHDQMKCLPQFNMRLKVAYCDYSL